MPSPMDMMGDAAQGPPQGAPSGPPSGGNPMQQLAQRPQGQSGPLLQLILSFLAGAGLREVIGSIGKLKSGMGGGRGAKGGDMNRPHQGGMKIEAGPPGTTATPSILNQAGQDPQQKQKLMQLLMMLAQKGQGGQMPPQG